MLIEKIHIDIWEAKYKSMQSIDDEKKWLYQNFNMVIELDIAGGFIYDGIKKIYEMSFFANDYETFSALYNIAVGIERLQKIVIVLWGLDNTDDYYKFGSSLKTHKHSALRDRINSELHKNGVKVKFTKDENDIIELVQKFYNTARYARFNYNNRWDEELLLLRNVLKKNNLIDYEYQEFNDDVLYITKEAKDYLGESIGSISRKYYQLIKEGSDRNATYTYETGYGTKAQKVFLKNATEPVSLITDQEIESQVLKELFLYFRNTKIKDPFLSFLDEFEPLDLDVAELPYYLDDIFKRKVSQDLIDAVQSLYEELDENEKNNRKERLSCIGNTNVDFEANYIIESFQIINKIYVTSSFTDDDVVLLEDNLDYIKDEEMMDILKALISECSNLVKEKTSMNEFKHRIDAIQQNFDLNIDEYLKNYNVADKNNS